MQTLTHNESRRCATRYPLVLVHGVAYRDDGALSYWSRIPATLEEHGARIFFGEQDAWGSYEHNACQLAARIIDILEQTKSEKVNIIAHSKGGLDARCLVSSLGAAPLVASLTTIASPHQGSASLESFFTVTKPFFKLLSFIIDPVYRKNGDSSPDFYGVNAAFGTRAMREFNRANPDAPEVCYQHYAAIMSSASSDPSFAMTYRMVKLFEGLNDGLVSLASTQYGDTRNFKGVLYAQQQQGVSHGDAVDSHRRAFDAQPPKKEASAIRQLAASGLPKVAVTHIPDFYVDLVADLATRGY